MFQTFSVEIFRLKCRLRMQSFIIICQGFPEIRGGTHRQTNYLSNMDKVRDEDFQYISDNLITLWECSSSISLSRYPSTAEEQKSQVKVIECQFRIERCWRNVRVLDEIGARRPTERSLRRQQSFLLVKSMKVVPVERKKTCLNNGTCCWKVRTSLHFLCR